MTANPRMTFYRIRLDIERIKNSSYMTKEFISDMDRLNNVINLLENKMYPAYEAYQASRNIRAVKPPSARERIHMHEQKQKERIRKYQQEGHEAFLAGIQHEDVPYPADTFERDNWLAGWGSEQYNQQFHSGNN